MRSEETFTEVVLAFLGRSLPFAAQDVPTTHPPAAQDFQVLGVLLASIFHRRGRAQQGLQLLGRWS